MPALFHAEMSLGATGIAEASLPTMEDEVNKEVPWTPTRAYLEAVRQLLVVADIVGTLVLWAPLRENHFEMAITGVTPTHLRLTRIK